MTGVSILLVYAPTIFKSRGIRAPLRRHWWQAIPLNLAWNIALHRGRLFWLVDRAGRRPLLLIWHGCRHGCGSGIYGQILFSSYRWTGLCLIVANDVFVRRGVT